MILFLLFLLLPLGEINRWWSWWWWWWSDLHCCGVDPKVSYKWCCALPHSDLVHTKRCCLLLHDLLSYDLPAEHDSLEMSYSDFATDANSRCSCLL